MFNVQESGGMKYAVLATLLSCTLSMVGCESDPHGDSRDEKLTNRVLNQGYIPIEPPNEDPAKVILGKALMFDKILSGNRNISCGTCHHPSLATGDNISLSIGTGGIGIGQERAVPLDDSGNPVFIPRNSPEIFNRGNFHTMFWDARVAELPGGGFLSPAGDDLLPGLDSALAVQAMFPVTSRAEMRGEVGESELGDLADDDLTGMWTALMVRLLAIGEYRQLFANAYPGVAEADLTFVHVANALAAFEIQNWTLPDSPFDRYILGETDALTFDERAGAELFFGDAGCVKCHSGPNLTDEDFHNIGVPQIGPGKGDGINGQADFGRERVTGDPADRYKFRTPPLHNVTETGPWMHDGAFTDLTDVIRHHQDVVTSVTNYDITQLEELLQDALREEETGRILENLDPLLSDFVLNEKKVDQIEQFLGTLAAPGIADLVENDLPDSVPSGLPID